MFSSENSSPDLMKKNLNSYAVSQDRPLIAGHRGMAGLLPENTIEALYAAAFVGADFIELDVVLTKDLQVLVAHDVYLSRLTKVAEYPEFSNRQKKRTYFKKEKFDWFVNDFTLEELRRFGVKQAIQHNRPTIYDYKFNFPTLNEVIQMLIEFNQTYKGKKNIDHRPTGILLEIKDPDYHYQTQKEHIHQHVYKVLQENGIETYQKALEKCPIQIMSFGEESLVYFASLTDLPRIRLVWQMSELYPISRICKIAQGIGIDLKLIWDHDQNAPHKITQQLREKGLFIYSWTIRDDDQKLLNYMQVKNSIELYRKLTKVLKLDGIITEFPEKAVNIISMFRNDLLQSLSENQTPNIQVIDELRTKKRKKSL